MPKEIKTIIYLRGGGVIESDIEIIGGHKNNGKLRNLEWRQGKYDELVQIDLDEVIAIIRPNKVEEDA